MIQLPKKPSKKEINKVFQFFRPLYWLNDPVFYGLDNIPAEGPVLFVGNHTLLGMWDTSIMWFKLNKVKDIFVYSLGDRAHHHIPFWSDLTAKFGVVEGSRENCAALMQQKEYILVFPGGAREAFKHKGEAYKLIWENRLGFARMAIANGCTIVPFSAVGAEECYELVWDSKEIAKSPLGYLLKGMGVRKDLMLPIVKGAGLTPLPRSQRFYYKFGTPISTKEYNEESDNDAYCEELKGTVKTAVEAGIQELLDIRKKDPNKKLFKRVLNKFSLFK